MQRRMQIYQTSQQSRHNLKLFWGMWLLTMLLLVAGSAAMAAAGDVVIDTTGPNTPVVVEWVSPTLNTDGTTLTDLDAFRLYWAFSTPAAYDTTRSVLIPDETLTEMTYPITVPGAIGEVVTVYLVLTAISLTGGESLYSNQISRTYKIIQTGPQPPTNLRFKTATISFVAEEGRTLVAMN